MNAGDERLSCEAPCLLLVPANTVHGFEWEEEATGSVIALATQRFSGLEWFAPESAGLLARRDVIPLPELDARRSQDIFVSLMLELAWVKEGHDMAVQAALLSIMVIVLRMTPHRPFTTREKGREHAIVARLHRQIEERSRLREPIGAYARSLGISETTL